MSHRKLAPTRPNARTELARGATAKASAPSPRNSSATGRQFAPAPSRAASDTPGARGGGAGPGEHARDQRAGAPPAPRAAAGRPATAGDRPAARAASPAADRPPPCGRRRPGSSTNRHTARTKKRNFVPEVTPGPWSATSRASGLLARLREFPPETLSARAPRRTANIADPDEPATREPSSPRSACAAGDESPALPRRRAVARREQARADVALHRDPGRAASRSAVATTGSTRTDGRGAGEGPQLLGPAQRRRPAHPAERVRGVGDHAQQQRRPRAGRAEADRARAASARAGWRARLPRRTPARPRRWPARGRPTPATPTRPTRCRRAAPATARPPRPAPTAASAARNAARRPTTPARTSSRRPASSSARSARTAANKPHTAAKTGRRRPRRQASVAADGYQVVRHAVEQPQPPGSRRRCARARRGPRRRVGAAVVDALRRGDEERTAARTRACARARRAARGGRPRQPGRTAAGRRSGAGRSPRATARG